MRAFTVGVAILSLAMGLGCAAILWRSTRRGATSAKSLLTCIALVATAGVAGGAAFAIAFGSVFAVAHWWYVLVVVSIPLAGAGILTATATAPRDTRMRPWPMALGALMLLPGLLGVYSTHIAPHRLRVSEYSVMLPAERTGHQPLKVAVLADIQTRAVGSHERAAIDAAIAVEPDLILVPGDVLQAPTREAQPQIPVLNEMFAELASTAPTLVVSGDVDNPTELEAILSGTGAQLLDNETVTMQVSGHQLAIAGITVVDGCGNPAHGPALAALDAVDDPAVTKLLLTHRPDPVLCLEDRDVDLVVAGHTHGGQIAVPGIGPLVTASEVPREVGGGGLHELDGIPIVVSRGIGMERNYAPQVRFAVPPEVVVLDLASH